jgi:hypothetical protein
MSEVESWYITDKLSQSECRAQSTQPPQLARQATASHSHRQSSCMPASTCAVTTPARDKMRLMRHAEPCSYTVTVCAVTVETLEAAGRIPAFSEARPSSAAVGPGILTDTICMVAVSWCACTATSRALMRHCFSRHQSYRSCDDAGAHDDACALNINPDPLRTSTIARARYKALVRAVLAMAHELSCA